MTQDTSSKPFSISIMIMTFNEVATLESVVHEIDGVLQSFRREYEIVIIDDGSTDGSGDVADRLAAEMPSVRVVHHEGNKGLGFVKQTGYRESRMDLVSFFPADGECPAGIITDFVPLMDEHDMVLGYFPERKDRLIPILLGKCERLLLRILLGKMPEFGGIYMFRRELLAKVPLTTEGRGWIIQMEFILRVYRAGYRITSMPTDMRLRQSGTSKVNNIGYIIANVKQVFALFWRIKAVPSNARRGEKS